MVVVVVVVFCLPTAVCRHPQHINRSIKSSQAGMPYDGILRRLKYYSGVLIIGHLILEVVLYWHPFYCSVLLIRQSSSMHCAWLKLCKVKVSACFSAPFGRRKKKKRKWCPNNVDSRRVCRLAGTIYRIYVCLTCARSDILSPGIVFPRDRAWNADHFVCVN